MSEDALVNTGAVAWPDPFVIPAGSARILPGSAQLRIVPGRERLAMCLPGNGGASEVIGTRTSATRPRCCGGGRLPKLDWADRAVPAAWQGCCPAAGGCTGS
jgi:hypothetical protein